jgi:hypothetical protein
MLRLALISGALANKPFNGGNAWSRLSWVSGFKQLGFTVYFVEQIGRDACVDSTGAACPFNESVNLAYFKETMAQFGMSHASALIYRDGEEVHGVPMTRLTSLAQEACLLFNISGHLSLPEIKQKPACKLYYDDDPGFTQFWHAAGNLGARLWDHDFYVTIGENIGKAECVIPTGGLTWHHTRPPVVLENWPMVAQGALGRFTTVASWRGAFGPIQHDGKTYGLKVHEFRKFIDVPQRSGYKFEIALQIHPADQKDLNALRAYGWHISDPGEAAGSPDAFRNFIQTSGAEFSVAQGIYVETNSGWFSDRTVRYLASGKPALVQDTGFSSQYPIGRGLLTFRTINEAIEGAKQIARDYPDHCKAARQIAEQYFDARKVIRAMASEIGLKIA